MKLNKREIFMITVLLGILLVYGYYNYIYMPIKANMNQLKSQVAEAEQTLKEYRLQVIPENRIYQDYEQALEYTQTIAGGYYPEMLQEEVILDLQTLIIEAGIQVSSINFSSPTYTAVTPRTIGEAASSSLEDLARSFIPTEQETKVTLKNNLGSGEQVKYMSITLNFTGSYNNIKNFVNLINQHRYRLVINNILLNSMDEQAQFVGSASIDVYSIPHIEAIPNKT